MASNQVEKGFWQRGERVFAYLGENRTRYASVAQTPEGRLLILFTHQTRAQKKRARANCGSCVAAGTAGGGNNPNRSTREWRQSPAPTAP